MAALFLLGGRCGTAFFSPSFPCIFSFHADFIDGVSATEAKIYILSLTYG
jgi:hypothetical protein